MPENPLLPNRRLRELYSMMQRCHQLDRKLFSGVAREAMMAAVSVHLLPGDLLSGAPEDTTARALAPSPRGNELAAGKSVAAADLSTPLPKTSRLALSSAMARGLQASGAGGVVVALAASQEPDAAWAQSLEFAQRAQVPLLLVCADSTDRRSSKMASGVSWPAVSRLATRLKLPLFPVDGEDAVAIYRVMQECTARARMGEGPAVIWCLLTPNGRKKLGRSQQPIERMKQYLAARGLLRTRPTSHKRVARPESRVRSRA